ncbi:hypothetical protein BC832DRAFT_566815 [Gaertneriomyces semiglobifer]|nr:hypothetical protein BC832DRAFT_566815 [Gaertneriomyces semiglobifer]
MLLRFMSSPVVGLVNSGQAHILVWSACERAYHYVLLVNHHAYAVFPELDLLSGRADLRRISLRTYYSGLNLLGRATDPQFL